jgi:hypothetical protein
MQIRRARDRRLRLLALAIFPLLTTTSKAQIFVSNISVAVMPQGDLGSFWSVRNAGVREEFDATTGYVEFQNASNLYLQAGVFYGEYLDAKGRLCFSLVFSQKDSSPVAPGQEITLYSAATSMFAAVQPKELRLFILQQSTANKAEPPRKWHALVRSPVTIGTRSLGIDEGRLELSPGGSHVLDLTLAKVAVSEAGKVTRVEILNAANGPIREWFEQFINRLGTFYPATNDGVPKADFALVLVRAVDSEDALLSSRASVPWVSSYISSSGGSEIAPVTEFLFRRPSSQARRLDSDQPLLKASAPLPPLELSSIQSEWSIPSFRWVTDLKMPQNRRRELASE